MTTIIENLKYTFIEAKTSISTIEQNSSTSTESLVPMIFLHGFLGSGVNLRMIAQKCSEVGYHCYLVDLRNHGSSFHSEEMSYSTMAKDVLRLIDTLKLNKVILCGHSMGGKVSMHFAKEYPNRLKSAIIMDMSPGERDISYFVELTNFLANIELNSYTSRQAVKEKIMENGYGPVLADFLLKNLATSPNLHWKNNLSSLAKNLTFLGKGLDFNSPIKVPILFVHGENSDYVQENDKKNISENFQNAEIKVIANAGHWIHYENLPELLRTIIKFLQK